MANSLPKLPCSVNEFEGFAFSDFKEPLINKEGLQKPSVRMISATGVGRWLKSWK